jgi:hypothetical protein
VTVRERHADVQRLGSTVNHSRTAPDHCRSWRAVCLHRLRRVRVERRNRVDLLIAADPGGALRTSGALQACGARRTRGALRTRVAFGAGRELGARESKEDWLELGRDLMTRGLAAPRLVLADGAPGLISAVEELWPRADRQHCCVHRLRNHLA